MFAMSVSVVFAETYTGTLTGDQLGGSGTWFPASISWTVEEAVYGSEWRYSYEFSAGTCEVSGFILQVSPNFTADNIWDASGDFEIMGLRNLEAEFYGIKFDGVCISFSSDRAPMWGNFYVADGQGNAAWTLNTGDWERLNAGGMNDNTKATGIYIPPFGDFTEDDGSGVIVNGCSYLGFILVPDSKGPPPVPEPSSLLTLMCGGMGLIGFAVRRRR